MSGAPPTDPTAPAPGVAPSSVIPEAQQLALQKAASERQAKADELNATIGSSLAVFRDPARSQNDRYFAGVTALEAENRLLAMAVQGVQAMGGLSSGIRDVLKLAAPQIESAQMAYREISSKIDEATGRIDRLERNLKTWIENHGGKYQL